MTGLGILIGMSALLLLIAVGEWIRFLPDMRQEIYEDEWEVPDPELAELQTAVVENEEPRP